MKLCLRCNQYFNDTLEVCPKDQATLEPVGKDPLIGALIDERYVIETVLGKGSSGIVYKASRLMMGGEVAVKVIHSYLGADSASLDRLLRELKAAERLRHAHIITVWDSGTTDDGQPYLVMDYLEGITLSQLITQKGALPPKRVLNVMRQVVEAMAHAHENGLIHRDMKPENVVLEESEIRGDYAKVLDFGIADTPQESAARAKFNRPKTVAGSPAYMSPEQCQGFELDYRSDLYSLGVITFEMFTGRRPFLAHDLMKLMYMTVTEPPPKMGQVRKDLQFPDAVEAVVARALGKLPDDRQPTVREFWRELETACQGLEFGKLDRPKTPTREPQKISELDIAPNERLIDEEKASLKKLGNFEPGPEDMPELYLPEASQEVEKTEIPNPGSPQPKPGSPPNPISGTVKQFQPSRIGPGASKPGGPPRPVGPGGLPPGPKPGMPGPQGAKPPGPGGPSGPKPPIPGAPISPSTGGPQSPKPGLPGAPTGPKPAPPPGSPPGPGGSSPGGPPKAPTPPPPPGAKPAPPPLPGAPPSAGGKAPPARSAPPPMPTSSGGAMGFQTASSASLDSLPSGQLPFPDRTMSRLSALVKRPASAAPPEEFDMPESDLPSALEHGDTAPEPLNEEPHSPNNNNSGASAKVPQELALTAPEPVKPDPEPSPGVPDYPSAAPLANKGPGPIGAKPGGAPIGAKPGGGPIGQKTGGAPLGAKPGGAPMGAKTGGAPLGAKPGSAPLGAKPGGAPAGANSGGPTQAKPGIPPGARVGGPGVGPGGMKPGGPQGAKPGGPGPQGAKPGSPTGAPSGTKPGGGPGPQGGKTGVSPGGMKPQAGGAPLGAKPGLGPQGGKPGAPLGAKPAGAVGPQVMKPGAAPQGAKPGGMPGPQGAKPAGALGPQGGKPLSAAGKAPVKPPNQTMHLNTSDLVKPEPLSTKESEKALPLIGDELTPALAKAGATFVDQDEDPQFGSLDGNLAADGDDKLAKKRMSNLDWEDEIEALKTGSVEPISVENLDRGQQNQWPPGVMPPSAPNAIPPGMPQGQMPGQMNNYQQMQQSWPPGMINAPPGASQVPGAPMMPPYDQSMSYPPGMLPYNVPPGYPPGYPPNQDQSGAYQMMPGYQMPPGQMYPYGAPGMPYMQPGMPMPGMPMGGMPPGVPPQGMPPQGMPPQGMPPGMLGASQFGSPGMTPDTASGALPTQQAPGGAVGDSLMDDLKSDFGDTPTPGAISNLLEEPAPGGLFEDNKDTEDVYEEEAPEASPSTPTVPSPPEPELDEAAKLAAKSAAEAEELGDSLLALIDATEKDRGTSGRSMGADLFNDPEPPKDSPKSSGTRALGSLLGAMTAADDDDLAPSKTDDPMGGNAFAAAVASSASVPSLSEKVKKDTSGSAFGQLLAAVKEEDPVKEPEPAQADSSGGGLGGLISTGAISDALDALLGPDEPGLLGGGGGGIGSPQAGGAGMKNPFADEDIKSSQVGGMGMNEAAARLAAAMEDDDESGTHENPAAYGGDNSPSVASSARPNPATSTSDALSRLLEAASKAPSKASQSGTAAAMNELDKMAARVNKPPAKISRKLAGMKSAEAEAEASKEPQAFGGFGGGAFGGEPEPQAFGGMPDPIRASGIESTSGTGSSYSQDAVNARIAELNRKLEQTSANRANMELPPAPAPEPSVISEPMNRRDVVNRIMEEAAMRHQYGADYQPPDPGPPASKPHQSGSDFAPSDLEKVNSNRLASMADAEQRRKKSSKSRSHKSLPRIPVVPIAIGAVVLGVLVFGVVNFGNISTGIGNMIKGMTPAEKPADKDAVLVTTVNDLMKAGKLNDARKMLEQAEDERGLTPELFDKLDNVYLSIAKYKKNQGATNEAVEILKLVTSDSAKFAEAQKLLKQYQKSGKKGSARRKRR
ncbi:MAG: protein kinase [Candidatus Obscuribacterales bacterium]|nr:protein kinase [Candidatus Obscuribacterales bacterium]